MIIKAIRFGEFRSNYCGAAHTLSPAQMMDELEKLKNYGDPIRVEAYQTSGIFIRNQVFVDNVLKYQYVEG